MRLTPYDQLPLDQLSSMLSSCVDTQIYMHGYWIIQSIYEPQKI